MWQRFRVLFRKCRNYAFDKSIIPALTFRFEVRRMPKGIPETQYKGLWKLEAPQGKKYKAHLQWKRFFAGPNSERYALFKIIPIKRGKGR